MFTTRSAPEDSTIGILLVPGFSLFEFSAITEPLRIANRLSGREMFRLVLVSADGAPVTASNGMIAGVDRAMADLADLGTLIVCASFEPARGATRPVLSALRKLARRGVWLGAVDTGTQILASAGLLEGAPVTMHWEAVPGFRELFPAQEIAETLFELAPKRFTCAGGVAVLDMMLAMIALRQGEAFARDVGAQFIHDTSRPGHAPQRGGLARRLGTGHPALSRVLAAMESEVETPPGNAALARLAGLSLRQFERLFRARLGQTPGQVQTGLRLERARHLLRQTSMPLLDVALATGFSNASALARAYRARYGLSPGADRRDHGFALRSGPVHRGEGAAAVGFGHADGAAPRNDAG